MKKVLVVLFLVGVLATVSQAAVINSFVNANFDSGATTDGALAGFRGFDAPCTEIIGWTNYRDNAPGLLNDAGVEGPSAWWIDDDTLYNQAAFMSAGDAAYTMSTYTINSGDEFNIKYLGGCWDWTGTSGEWTATLFYNTPNNVIGSYVQGIANWFGDDVWYSSSTNIAATPASVGGTLGILFKNTGSKIAQLDEVSVNVVPEPATLTMLVLVGAFGLVYRRIRKK
jgi:hypothetical protein